MKFKLILIAFFMFTFPLPQNALAVLVCCHGRLQDVEPQRPHGYPTIYTLEGYTNRNASYMTYYNYCGYRIYAYNMTVGLRNYCVVSSLDACPSCTSFDADGDLISGDIGDAELSEGEYLCPPEDMCPDTPFIEKDSVDSVGCSCSQRDDCETGYKYFTTKSAYDSSGKLRYKEIMVSNGDGEFIRYEEYGDPDFYDDCSNGSISDCTSDSDFSHDPFGPNNKDHIKDYDTELKRELETDANGDYPEIYGELPFNPNYDGPAPYYPEQNPTPPDEEATPTPEVDPDSPNPDSAQYKAIIENQGKQLRAQQTRNGSLADIKKGIDSLNKKNFSPNVNVSAPGYDGPSAAEIAAANDAKNRTLDTEKQEGKEGMSDKATKGISDLLGFNAVEKYESFAKGLTAEEITENFGEDTPLGEESWFSSFFDDNQITYGLEHTAIETISPVCSIGFDFPLGKSTAIICNISLCEFVDQFDMAGRLMFSFASLYSLIIIVRRGF